MMMMVGVSHSTAAACRNAEHVQDKRNIKTLENTSRLIKCHHKMRARPAPCAPHRPHTHRHTTTPLYIKHCARTSIAQLIRVRHDKQK